jgi:7-cyano-7-deazaguanine tRNA-ribosyltransferase
VLRHNYLLHNLTVKGKALITTRKGVESRGFDSIYHVKVPFGVYPEALNETYPIGQSETIDELECDARDATLENIYGFILSHREADFTFIYDAIWDSPVIERIKTVAVAIRLE